MRCPNRECMEHCRKIGFKGGECRRSFSDQIMRCGCCNICLDDSGSVTLATDVVYEEVDNDAE